MKAVPRVVKFGGALGFIGGVISIVCLAFFFNAGEGALVDMGAYMLIAVMFFAVAGGLAKDGQWSWNVLLLMGFLTIGVVGSSVVFEAVDLYAGAILMMVGALIVLCLAFSSTRIWANRMRI